MKRTTNGLHVKKKIHEGLYAGICHRWRQGRTQDFSGAGVKKKKKRAPVNRKSQWRDGTSSCLLHWRSRLEGTLIDFLHWKGTTGGTLSFFLLFSDVLLKHGGTGRRGSATLYNHPWVHQWREGFKVRIKGRKRGKREINNKWRDAGWEGWRSCNYITVYVLH